MIRKYLCMIFEITHLRCSLSTNFCSYLPHVNFQCLTVYLLTIKYFQLNKLQLKRLHRRCFLVNFAQFLKTSVLLNTLGWMFLRINSKNFSFSIQSIQLKNKICCRNLGKKNFQLLLVNTWWSTHLILPISMHFT